MSAGADKRGGAAEPSRDRADRHERLADALRRNLRKRKVQARGRGDAGAPAEPAAPETDAASRPPPGHRREP